MYVDRYILHKYLLRCMYEKLDRKVEVYLNGMLMIKHFQSKRRVN